MLCGGFCALLSRTLPFRRGSLDSPWRNQKLKLNVWLVKHQLDNLTDIAIDLVKCPALRDDTRLFEALSDEPTVVSLYMNMQEFHLTSRSNASESRPNCLPIFLNVMRLITACRGTEDWRPFKPRTIVCIPPSRTTVTPCR